MGRIYKDRKGYPRFKGSNKLIHRAVASKKVGGKLFKDRVVHHKDGNKSNFRRGNLQVMSRKAHSRLHAKKRRRWWYKNR